MTRAASNGRAHGMFVSSNEADVSAMYVCICTGWSPSSSNVLWKENEHVYVLYKLSRMYICHCFPFHRVICIKILGAKEEYVYIAVSESIYVQQHNNRVLFLLRVVRRLATTLEQRVNHRIHTIRIEDGYRRNGRLLLRLAVPRWRRR